MWSFGAAARSSYSKLAAVFTQCTMPRTPYCSRSGRFAAVAKRWCMQAGGSGGTRRARFTRMCYPGGPARREASRIEDLVGLLVKLAGWRYCYRPPLRQRVAGRRKPQAKRVTHRTGRLRLFEALLVARLASSRCKSRIILKTTHRKCPSDGQRLTRIHHTSGQEAV